ncbi:MAG TPA: VanZ family protein [Candidatus Acidoferrum sp.]|nr:VanZ family protein [Candidatus Acidoferrum sp.]
MLRRLTYWLPAIGMAILISGFSTEYFSGEHTSRIILPALRWLFPSATPDTLLLLHFGIRKAAHITEFGFFSIAVFRGIRGERQGWRPEWALIALFMAAGYAGLDEWHQSFVPMREARFRDVLIDSTGAVLAQALAWGYLKFHRNSLRSLELNEKASS